MRSKQLGAKSWRQQRQQDEVGTGLRHGYRLAHLANDPKSGIFAWTRQLPLEANGTGMG